jgi:hypothetical protein
MAMESNWAAEHLQVIRTLMERSAVYRRALAPIMLVSGLIGLLSAVVPCFVKIETDRAFGLFWIAVSLATLVASFLLVRRQALKEAEPFWSPPTRRVTQAILPAFLIGLAAGFLLIIQPQDHPPGAWLLAIVWITAYGCAMHAAGFFMERGIKLFGWAFVVGGCGVLLGTTFWPRLQTTEAAHYVMGMFFGVLQLAYGIYLYFTEQRKSAA